MKRRTLVEESTQIGKFGKKTIMCTNVGEIYDFNQWAIKGQRKVFLTKKHARSVITKLDCKDSIVRE